MASEKKESFSTQERIFAQLGIKDEHGLCSPLANLYARFKMGQGSHQFLDEGPKATYDYAREMEQHQSEVAQQVSRTHGSSLGSLMSMHVAFWDAHKIPWVQEVPVSQLNSFDRARKTLENPQNELPEHMLINIPTRPTSSDTTSPYHQVYLGHTLGTNLYSYFNSNRDRGEMIGTCNEVLKALFDDFSKSVAHDGRKCLIGSSLP